MESSGGTEGYPLASLEGFGTLGYPVRPLSLAAASAVVKERACQSLLCGFRKHPPHLLQMFPFSLLAMSPGIRYPEAVVQKATGDRAGIQSTLLPAALGILHLGTPSPSVPLASSRTRQSPQLQGPSLPLPPLLHVGRQAAQQQDRAFAFISGM